MQEAPESSLDEEVEFPTIPQEKIPQEAVALRRILAGQRGLQLLYEKLDGMLTGETHCLAALLRRDWERAFGGLLRVADRLVESLAGGKDEPDMLPRAEQIENIVRSLDGKPPEKVLEVVAEVASKALICCRMVPWVSNVKEVFEHFRECVEAEDHHLAVLQLFGEMLRPLEKPQPA